MSAMESALVELERIQERILRRLSDLELSLLPKHFTDSLSLSSSADAGGSDADTSNTAERLSAILRANDVVDFSFKRVPADYYEWTLEARRDILGAASIHHLCKSIVLVNTKAPTDVTDCIDQNFSKYYIVVVQYTARFNAEMVKSFLYALNDGKIPKKKINSIPLDLGRKLIPLNTHLISHNYALTGPTYAVRLAPVETSMKLTGYVHNAVTCVGLRTDIPVILDEAIAILEPDFFWLGGGEPDLKLGFRTRQFIDYVKPFIVPCSES